MRPPLRKPSRNTQVTISVLDRLMDDRPDETHETRHTNPSDLQAQKRMVARDMEHLLNARRPDWQEALAEFPETEGSVFNYGIPDLSGLSLLSPDDRQYLRASLEQAISHNEKRLKNVRVILEVARNQERVLHFRVDAVLEIHPSRPAVMFDAVLQLNSNVYKVKGEG